MSIIKCIGLTRYFGKNAAIEKLDLEVEEGQIFGLVGPDGAGKTTAMRLLSGILVPTSGDAWVADLHTVRDSQKLRELIAYMPQRFGLYEDLTVIENINFYADIYTVSSQVRPQRIRRLLDFTRLTPFKNRLTANLSGGMKQKLGIACALIHTPKILFLDEPTNGVDPVSRRQFWNILYELLKEKVTIFFSTAYLDEAERCNVVGLLHKGKLLTAMPPQEIKRRFDSSNLEQAFIKIINEQEHE
jgi:ABC-2 type transport system ATP-binding protein